MASVYEEISSQVRRLLAGQLSPEELEYWIVEYSWNIHQRADERSAKLAYIVDSYLSDHNDGLISESELRRRLATVIGIQAKPTVASSAARVRRIESFPNSGWATSSQTVFAQISMQA